MNQVVTLSDTAMSKIEEVLIKGDLSKLNEGERVNYARAVCSSMGLSILTKPFEYITLNGKLTLYATKACTDQLRSLRGVSVRITSRETIEGVYVVTAQAKLADGREDESTGAVPIGTLKGDALANAMMKAETKAKRRVTLSICGLGMLDESEVETIPGAGIAPSQPEPGDGFAHDDGYRIPAGKYAKRSLEEVNPKDLANYVEWMESNSTKTGKPLDGWQKDFVERASDYLGHMENGTPEDEPAA